MTVGDLVRWTKTDKICIYLGMEGDMHKFWSGEYGIVERWDEAFTLLSALEVVK